jgi:hypothetical protein
VILIDKKAFFRTIAIAELKKSSEKNEQSKTPITIGLSLAETKTNIGLSTHTHVRLHVDWNK